MTRHFLKDTDLSPDELTEVLDLATTVGAVLLDSGTGAIDTRDQVAFVASIYGLDDVERPPWRSGSLRPIDSWT